MSTAISACLIVRNESQLLAGCLDSIRKLCSEIIVVDTGSTDDTCEIARGAGARVFHHRWDDDYASARNASLAHARGDWILVIDADETIAARDLPQIRRLVTRARGAGYRLLVRNYTRDFNVTWNWQPNDGSYPKEEQRSHARSVPAGPGRGR
jgi:O-antigen biosynthesis protein